MKPLVKSEPCHNMIDLSNIDVLTVKMVILESFTSHIYIHCISRRYKIIVKLFMNMMNTFMYHICLLSLCIYPNDIETLSCVVPTHHKFGLQPFDLDHFQKTINSLNTEIFYDDTMCRVQFYKIYNLLAIWFGDETTLTVHLNEGDIYFNTMVSLKP